MKKYLYIALSILLITVPKILCAAEEISPDIEQSLKSTSSEPNFFTIAFALIFVIILIYITGLIYSKLNVVGAKAVRQQIKNHDLSRVVVLSTTQLGQGKNLHVIELNNKKYLIGAAQNNISMLKELGDIEKEKSEPNLQQEVEQSDAPIEEIISLNEKSEDEIYKKYL